MCVCVHKRSYLTQSLGIKSWKLSLCPLHVLSPGETNRTNLKMKHEPGSFHASFLSGSVLSIQAAKYHNCMSYVHPWLIHVTIWQKPPQNHKVISLQLKFKKEIKKKFLSHSSGGWKVQDWGTSMAGWEPYSWFTVCDLSLYPHMVERARVLCGVFFMRTLISFMRAHDLRTAERPLLLIPSSSGSYDFNMWIWGGYTHSDQSRQHLT